MPVRVWEGSECWLCGPAFQGGPVVRFRRDDIAELLLRYALRVLADCGVTHGWQQP
jgi:hypothetical protein